MLLLASWAAHAADGVVTAVGTQAVYDQGLGAADVDPLLSERLRWTLADGATLLGDARFTLDPAAPDPWEQHRVRTLGVELAPGDWTIRLGRHAVERGGPRLVDGVEIVRRTADWGVGGWAGLAPDLFTTRPRVRPGGGPIVTWDRPEVQASLVGEVLAADGGGGLALDRAGALAQVRWAPSAAASLAGRLDVQLLDRPSLADGALIGQWRPSRSVRLDALYDAYGSLRYLETADLDPDLQRFAARAGAGITADLVDDSLYQLAGVGGAWQARTPVAPRLAVTARYRHHARVEDRFATVVPQAGLLGLAGGRLDATVDLAWTWRDTGSREDVGLVLVLDPYADGRAALDGSVRLIVDPALDGPGWYADLFADLVGLDSFVLSSGASVLSEPSEVPGPAVAGYLWLQHRLRRDQPEATTRLP